MRITLKRLNNSGVAHHFLVALIAIVIVASFGAYKVFFSKAATAVPSVAVTTDSGCWLAGRKFVDSKCTATCRSGAGVYKSIKGESGAGRGYCDKALVPHTSITKETCVNSLHRKYVTDIGCTRRADQDNTNGAPQCMAGYPNYIAEGTLDRCVTDKIVTETATVDKMTPAECAKLGRKNPNNTDCSRVCYDGAGTLLKGTQFYCNLAVNANWDKAACDNVNRVYIADGCTQRWDTKDLTDTLRCKAGSTWYNNDFKSTARDTKFDVCETSQAAATEHEKMNLFGNREIAAWQAQQQAKLTGGSGSTTTTVVKPVCKNSAGTAVAANADNTCPAGSTISCTAPATLVSGKCQTTSTTTQVIVKPTCKNSAGTAVAANADNTCPAGSTISCTGTATLVGSTCQVTQANKGSSAPESYKITLYDKPNFKGASKTFTGSTSPDQLADLKSLGFNDKTSSLKVEKGLWKVCLDASFNKCFSTWSSIPDLSKKPELKRDNQVSSLKPSAEATLGDPDEDAPPVCDLNVEFDNNTGKCADNQPPACLPGLAFENGVCKRVVPPAGIAVPVDKTISERACLVLGREWLTKASGNPEQGCSLVTCNREIDGAPVVNSGKQYCINQQVKIAYAVKTTKKECTDLKRFWVEQVDMCGQVPVSDKRKDKTIPKAIQCANKNNTYFVRPGKADECFNPTTAERIQNVMRTTGGAFGNIVDTGPRLFCGKFKKGGYNYYWDKKSDSCKRKKEMYTCPGGQVVWIKNKSSCPAPTTPDIDIPTPPRTPTNPTSELTACLRNARTDGQITGCYANHGTDKERCIYSGDNWIDGTHGEHCVDKPTVDIQNILPITFLTYPANCQPGKLRAALDAGTDFKCANNSNSCPSGYPKGPRVKDVQNIQMYYCLK